jgi:alpha-L-rhamnosidase
MSVLRQRTAIVLTIGVILCGFSLGADAQRALVGGRALDLQNEQHTVEWNARWIQHPMFRNLPFRFLYRQQKEADVSGVEKTDPKNIHTLFRKSFELPDKPIQRAHLFITADDVYKLYCNNAFIGLGPAPGYLFAYPYNGWDVTDYLTSGVLNCLGVHVYYQGLVNRVWGSGDNMQGLLAQLEITYRDGSVQTIATDGTWKYKQSHAYDSERLFGYKTQYAEDIDMRQILPDWSSPQFDDQTWEPAFAGGNPVLPQYTLVPQITPPLAYEKVRPMNVVKTGEGRYFIDFGTELTGTTCFVVQGPEGHVVEIRHGEELLAENEVRYAMRAGCVYQEWVTLSDRPVDHIEFFDYKGFRYVEVLNWPEELRLENVWVLNRHYPFDEDASAFTSSDELLNQIWQLCENGVKQGTQDTYLDCPTREKGAYLGDAYVTGQSHLYLTGDTRVLKKTLQDFAHTARICPGLIAVAPGNYMQEIADYSLLWPVILERYYMWSGDLDFVQDCIPVLDGLLEWFAQYENAEGLLENVTEKWNLVDWPQNLRDNYDYERAETGVNTVLNHFYYGCLQSAKNLYDFVEQTEKSTALDATLTRLAASARHVLVNEDTGLFVDAAGSSHSALHANALSPMFGLFPPSGVENVTAFLKEKRIVCGVYFAAFLLEGLYRIGEGDFAYELITSKDVHSWYTMLAAGATTCMEAWGPDQKWNTSWCHPWSSCPNYLLPAEMMGLKPSRPGWDEFVFAPMIPDDLAEASVTLTTPKGKVSAKFKQTETTVVYELVVPEGSLARLSLLEAPVTISVDNKTYTVDGKKTAFGKINRVVPVQLHAGKHIIRIEKE